MRKKMTVAGLIEEKMVGSMTNVPNGTGFFPIFRGNKWNFHYLFSDATYPGLEMNTKEIE